MFLMEWQITSRGTGRPIVHVSMDNGFNTRIGTPPFGQGTALTMGFSQYSTPGLARSKADRLIHIKGEGFL